MCSSFFLLIILLIIAQLFLSFDYFKKLTIQKVYEINDYDEVIKQSSIYDEFAKNPTNLIVKGLPVFEKNNIPRIIANKYKLNNLLKKGEIDG